MNIKALGCLAAFAAGSCSFVSCSEPATQCQVGLAGAYPFAVRYTAVSSPACAMAPGFNLQKGDLLGMEDYYAASEDGTTFDDSVPATVAVQSDTLGNEIRTYGAYLPTGTDTHPAHVPYALGTFTSVYPGADDMCQVTGFAPAQEDFTAVTDPSGARPSLPADGIQQTWASFSVYVTAADQGTQFSGDLTMTENGCTVQYHAVGLWPGVPCTGYDDQPDERYCNPCADPGNNRPVGSGISPDARTKCMQILPTDDPYKVQDGVPDPCTTDADCANEPTYFTSTCVNKQCTTCLNSEDCGRADACVGGFCFTRTPYWCVLDAGEPPVLAPNPPTCEDTGGDGTGGLPADAGTH